MLLNFFIKYFKVRFLQMYTLSVLLFSILYYLSSNYLETNGFVDTYFPKTDAVNQISYLDCLHFSLVTQTTVGYGRFEPNGKISKIINMFQLLSIVIIFFLDKLI
jgi:hypothetical protein